MALPGVFTTSKRAAVSLGVVYATVSGEEIARAVSTLYELPPVESCRLMRRGFNDTYEIRTTDGRGLFARLQAVAMRHFWLLGEYAGRLPEWGMEGLPRRYLAKQVELLDGWRTLRLPRALHRQAAGDGRKRNIS